MNETDKPTRESTAVQNPVQYRPSSTYYARFKAGGNVFWKSLATTVSSAARQRLPDTIRDHRAKAESSKAFNNGEMTMADAHVGYVLPIGDVLATDNAVVPYSVGVDIACRMAQAV